MNKKILIACALGNVFEFYDLGLYSALSFIMIPLFFPPQNPEFTLLLGMGVFVFGFIARPIGGLIFGYLGDKHGRKKTLSVNMLLMAFSSMIMGCLPSYATVGYVAPIIFILMRVMQGVCLGGEYNGSAIFLLENSPSITRYKLSSYLSAASLLGFLTSSLIGYLFLDTVINSWSWRIPLWVGSLIGMIGLYMRYHLKESQEFSQAIKLPENSSTLKEILSNQKSAFLSTLGIGWFSGAYALYMVSYQSNYFISILGMEKNIAVFLIYFQF